VRTGTGDRLGLTVLARICAGGDKGVTETALRKDLRALVPEGDIASAVERLGAEDLVARAGKGKTIKWQATAAGLARAREILGLPEKLPTWSGIRDLYLLGQALGVRPETAADVKWVKSSANLQGAVIARAQGLDVPPRATKKQVLDALFWKRIGIETDDAFTVSNIRKHLLRELVGVSREAYKPAQLETLLAAQSANAKRSTAPALRAALLQDWLGAGSGASAEPPASAAPSAEMSLADFAASVLAVVRSMAHGRFGDDLVFVAPAYEAWGRRHAAHDRGLADFKERLLAAHRADLIHLVRADLVEAMPKDVVEASEITYLYSVFHFICLEPS